MTEHRTTVYVLSMTRLKDGCNLRLTVHSTLEGAKAEGAKWAGERMDGTRFDTGWREHQADYARHGYWDMRDIDASLLVIIDPREVEA